MKAIVFNGGANFSTLSRKGRLPGMAEHIDGLTNLVGFAGQIARLERNLFGCKAEQFIK
jgi:hypothetical protein